jgi:hypothetical protein
VAGQIAVAANCGPSPGINNMAVNVNLSNTDVSVLSANLRTVADGHLGTGSPATVIYLPMSQSSFGQSAPLSSRAWTIDAHGDVRGRKAASEGLFGPKSRITSLAVRTR